MTLFNLSLPHLQASVLAFIRISAIMVTVPLFSSRNVPLQVKVVLALGMAVIVLPTVHLPAVEGVSVPVLVSGMVGEVLIGVIIGFTARLLFAGVELAGQLVGFQMGFGIVNVIDPQTSTQVSIIAHFQNIITMLLFLAFNAHHYFILAIAKSFELVPPLMFCLTNAAMEALIALSCNMFIIAAKVAAPVIAVLLFTNVALGLIARTVPQMNIFIVGFPLNLSVGLFGVGISLPVLSSLLRSLFQDMGEDIMMLLRLMS